MNIKLLVFSIILLFTSLIYAQSTSNGLTEAVNIKDVTADKKLIDAASGGEISDMETAVKEGGNINSKDNYGVPVIINAVDSYDNLAKIELLIRLNADVNAKDNDGRNALFYIAGKIIYDDIPQGMGGDGEKPEDPRVRMNKIASLLIKAKIDVITPDNNGITVLQLAIANKHKKIEQMIRKAGAKK